MNKRRKQPSRLDYCQFLLASQVNYTMTYFAAHSEQWSHDAVKRYLMNESLSGKEVWEHTRGANVMPPRAIKRAALLTRFSIT
jgi:hypothetical protein